MKSIAIFNNKGGVGKTTLLCNLASHLCINKKNKVLVIDADPQCNTTTYVLDEEQFLNVYYEPKCFTIADITPPLQSGVGYIDRYSAIQSKHFKFDILVIYHTQGEVIYWKYLDIEPPGARVCGEAMAAASGYALEDTPYASGHAGFKDWFILEYDKPGYTIECGLGENPLPISEFDEIYPAVRALLARVVLGC